MDSASPSFRSRLVATVRVVATIVKAPFRAARTLVRVISAPFRFVCSVRSARAERRAEKQARRSEARLEAMEPWEKREVERASRLKKD
ncbi:MAG: hypothetical protein O3C27_09270 [Actinomycetota bacterium]|nr:hypothetical protein [Actinomycetota bacterium]